MRKTATNNPLSYLLEELEASDPMAEIMEDTDFIRRNRDRLPSESLQAGLRARYEQINREGGYDPQRKPWDYFLYDLDLKYPLDQFDRSLAHDLAAPRSERQIPVSILHAYAHRLGWRVIPGVAWACDITGDHGMAVEFTRACRGWARDADAIWRLVASTGDSHTVREAKARLVRPLVERIRTTIADAIEELQGHPDLADAYFSNPDEIRRVGF